MRKKSTTKKAAKNTEEVTHKPIGEVFNKGGFEHKLVQREGDVAIYSKERIKKPWCDYYHAGYEVGIIKRHNGYKLGNQVIEPAETWPCTTLFGILGWAFVDLRDAERKFRELVHAIKDKTLVVNEEDLAEGEDDKD